VYLRVGLGRLGQLLEAGADGLSRAFQVRVTHVSVAEEQDRLVAPGLGVETVLVVIVVSPPALGRVSPGARDMARGERVLQEMEREGLEGREPAREGASLRGIGLLFQGGGRMQGRDVEQHVCAVSVQLGPAPESQRHVLGRIVAIAREKEVRLVRESSGRVLGIGSREAQVPLDHPVAPQVLGLGTRNLRRHPRRDGGHLQDPVALQDRLEHRVGRAGVVAGDRGPRGVVDARRLLALVPGIGLLAKACFMTLPRFHPEPVELCAAARIELLDAAGADRAVFRIEPRACGRSAGHEGREQEEDDPRRSPAGRVLRSSHRHGQNSLLAE
jgi:hypothetical protein